MFKSKKVLFVTLAILAFGLSACRTGAPIQNFSNTVTPLGQEERTADEMKKGIERASVLSGWQVKDGGPNQIIATLINRVHTVRVTIEYTQDSYTIQYLDSVNMDEKDGTIHPKYNMWVQRLSNNIARELYRNK